MSKTKYIIFQPRQKLNFNLHLPIILAGQPLNYSFNVKYLGLVIDCHLSWHDHIDYTCSKISKSINILTKVKKFMSKETLINMYYSFIFPYLTYGSILWGNNYYSPISDVVKLQNRATRIINDVPILDNITPHYVNLSILKFPDIVKLHTCLFLYDHLCDAKPSNFRIPLSTDQHSYTTRKVSSDQLYIPFFRTNIKTFCPTIIGRYFWNDLPASIRSRPTKKLFKNFVFKLYFSYLPNVCTSL